MKVSKLVEIIDALEDILESGKDAEQILCEKEAESGFMVIRPGEVDWLPLSDWDSMTIVSMQPPVVRLVAIWARIPDNGAFRRLCEALKAKGLVPHVVAPVPEMQERLRRWRWRRHARGNWLDHEEWWTPRAKAPESRRRR